MNDQKYQAFQEMLKLIAQYDWAVEGGIRPEDQLIDRETGKNIRDGLVRLAKTLTE